MLGPGPGAAATGRIVQFAQNVPDAGRETAQPDQPPVPGPAPVLRANSPEQIRKAQTELRRLDCFQGRIDGKLGDQTRQAAKKFWAGAKQPVVEINITDEMISNLAERGDNFCRPPRRFFGFGGRQAAFWGCRFPSFPAPGQVPSPPRVRNLPLPLQCSSVVELILIELSNPQLDQKQASSLLRREGQ
jgi:hypothetical protein